MITNKTYNQLYWDKEFVEKRILEQKEYIAKIPIRVYTGRYDGWADNHNQALPSYKGGEPLYDRRDEGKLKSANAVLRRFERQLENIKKLLI